MMDYDLQPYITHYAVSADIAQDNGDLPFWSTLEVDIPQHCLAFLESAARSNGCDLETFLASVARKKAREVLAAHGMLDEHGRLKEVA